MRVPLVLASIGGAIALVTCIGWLAAVPAFTTWGPRAMSMKFNTAIALIMCAGAVVAATRDTRAARAVTTVLALLALEISSAALYERLTGADLHVDQWFVRDPSSDSPGRMATNSAIAILFLSLSLLTLNRRWLRARVTNLVAAVPALIALFVIVGYVYRLAYLYSAPPHTRAALNTAIALLTLSLGVMFTRRENAWLLRGMSVGTVSGRLLRVLLPSMIVACTFMGWLRLGGEHIGLIDSAVGLALLVTANILAFVVLIIWSAWYVDGVDAARQARAAELANSEERFRLVALATNDLIFDWDVPTGKVWLNDVLRTTFGYREIEIEPTIQWWRNRIAPDDRERCWDAFNAVLASRATVWNHECRFVRGDGSEVEVLVRSVIGRNAGGVAERVIATITDLSRTRDAERLRAEVQRRELLEKEILRERDFASGILETIGTLLVVVDRELRVVQFNRACELTTGWRAEEVIGRSIVELFLTEDERDKVALFVSGVLSDHGAPTSIENYWRTRDGRLRRIAWSTSAVHDADGFPQYVIGSGVDVTDERNAQEDIRRQRDQLAEASAALQTANAELEAFTYSVSHDLRAPLRSIDGFSQALQEECSEAVGEEGRDYLYRIRGATQRMSDLIEGLLALSRVSRSQLHTDIVDLADLAEEAVTGLRRESPGRHVDVVVRRPLLAVGDRRLLSVVIANLMQNAWKFTAKSTQPTIEVTATNDGAFCVRDNGVGFDPEFAHKLFAPFQRLHRVTDFPGVGVGLATVQRILHRHGGRAWAESDGANGATFYFTLPGPHLRPTEHIGDPDVRQTASAH